MEQTPELQHAPEGCGQVLGEQVPAPVHAPMQQDCWDCEQEPSVAQQEPRELGCAVILSVPGPPPAAAKAPTRMV